MTRVGAYILIIFHVGKYVLPIVIILYCIGAIKNIKAFERIAQFIVVCCCLILAVSVIRLIVNDVRYEYKLKSEVKNNLLLKSITDNCGELLRYNGFSMSSNNQVVYYNFVLIGENEELVNELTKTVNNYCDNNKCEECFSITCWYDNEQWSSVRFSLSNYYMNDNYEFVEKSDNIISLRIILDDYSFGAGDGYYNNTNLYKKVPGIKYLYIIDHLENKSVEKENDWKQYYPNLEVLKIEN